MSENKKFSISNMMLAFIAMMLVIVLVLWLDSFY